MSWMAALMLGAALAAPSDRLEADAKALEAALISPCCWTQQVSLHQSQAAETIRVEIRDMLREGRSRDDILRSYRERYGTRILAEPPREGFTAVLYVVPWFGLFAGAGLVALVVRAFASRRPAAVDGRPPAVEDALVSRLDDELRDLD